MTSPTPLVVPLNHDLPNGAAINPRGWTGVPANSQLQVPPGSPPLHFIGGPKGVPGEAVPDEQLTRIGPITHIDAALHIYPDGAPLYAFENYDIGEGSRWCVTGGRYHEAYNPELHGESPMGVAFHNCRISEQEIGDGVRPFWGVSLTQASLHVSNCRFGLSEGVEHCVYLRNMPPAGLRVQNSTFGRCGGQHLKTAARPWEGPTRWNPSVRIYNSSFHDCGQDDARRSYSIDLSDGHSSVEMMGCVLQSAQKCGAFSIWAPNGGHSAFSVSLVNCVMVFPNADRSPISIRDAGQVRLHNLYVDGGGRPISMKLDPGAVVTVSEVNTAGAIALAHEFAPNEVPSLEPPQPTMLIINGEMVGPIHENRKLVVQ